MVYCRSSTVPQLHRSAFMASTVVRQCDLQLEVQIMQNDVTKWHWPPGNCTRQLYSGHWAELSSVDSCLVFGQGFA